MIKKVKGKFIPLFKRMLSLVSLSTEQFVIVFFFGIGALCLAQIIKRFGGTI